MWYCRDCIYYPTGEEKGCQNPDHNTPPKVLDEKSVSCDLFMMSTDADVRAEREETQENKAGVNIKEVTIDELANAILHKEKRKLVFDLPDDHFLSIYARWIESISDAYIDYAYGCGLWILSAGCQGKVVLELKQGDIKPNLWLQLLGMSTTSRKSTVVTQTRKIYEVATNESLPNQDYSLEGYLESLSQNPLQHNVRDEVSGFLSKCHRKYNDGFFDAECMIYDGQDYTKMLASKGKKEPQAFNIRQPYVTKLYATTPDSYARYITLDDFYCGYGYRFLFVYPDYKHDRKPIQLKSDEDIRAWGEVLQRVKAYYNHFSHRHEYEPEHGQVLRFTASRDVMEYYDRICMGLEEWINERSDEMLNAVVGRSEIHILKIAMLLELGKAKMSTELTAESIEAAAGAVIDYFIPCAMNIINQIQEDVKNNRIEKVLLALRRLGGRARRTQLLKNSHLVAREFNECIDTLLESGSIEQFRLKGSKVLFYELIDEYQSNDVRTIRKVRNNRMFANTDNNVAKIAKTTTDGMNGDSSSRMTCGIGDDINCEHANPVMIKQEPVLIHAAELLKAKYDGFRKPDSLHDLEHLKSSMDLLLARKLDISGQDSKKVIDNYCRSRGWL